MIWHSKSPFLILMEWRQVLWLEIWPFTLMIIGG